jgi:hypothetical protein
LLRGERWARFFVGWPLRGSRWTGMDSGMFSDIVGMCVSREDDVGVRRAWKGVC